MGRSERAARTKEIIQFSSYFGEEINNKTSNPKRRFCDECLIKKTKICGNFPDETGRDGRLRRIEDLVRDVASPKTSGVALFIIDGLVQRADDVGE